MTIFRPNLASLLAVAFMPFAQALAQTRPSLDGTWTLVGAGAASNRTTVVAASGDAAFAVGDMGSGWGSAITFSHRADRLVLEYDFFSSYDLMAPLHYEFALDGRDVINEVTLGPGVTRLESRAEWRGDTLVISTRQAVPKEVAPTGTMAEVKRALRVVGGDSLRITTTRVGLAGAPTNTVQSVYVRKR